MRRYEKEYTGDAGPGDEWKKAYPGCRSASCNPLSYPCSECGPAKVKVWVTVEAEELDGSHLEVSEEKLAEFGTLGEAREYLKRVERLSAHTPPKASPETVVERARRRP